MSKKVFPIYASSPLELIYDPNTGELTISYVDLHPAREGGFPMELRFPPREAKELLSAIRKLQIVLDEEPSAPESKHFLQ